MAPVSPRCVPRVVVHVKTIITMITIMVIVMILTILIPFMRTLASALRCGNSVDELSSSWHHYRNDNAVSGSKLLMTW